MNYSTQNPAPNEGLTHIEELERKAVVSARIDLTTEQKEVIIRGVNRGFSDSRIAAKLGLTQYLVRNYRSNVLMISPEEVTEKKYAQWRKQIEEGVDIEVVASRYGVKAISIKQILYQRFPGFSLTESKKKRQQKDNSRANTGLDEPW